MSRRPGQHAAPKIDGGYGTHVTGSGPITRHLPGVEMSRSKEIVGLQRVGFARSYSERRQRGIK
jgi:hypothetical protein